jgi:hypothetical protein
VADRKWAYEIRGCFDLKMSQRANVPKWEITQAGFDVSILFSIV